MRGDFDRPVFIGGNLELWRAFHRAVKLFALIVGLRMVVLGVAAIGLAYAGNYRRFYDVATRWPRLGAPTFSSHFMAWDGAHYQFLAENGYVHNAESCAFYPLWPALVSLTLRIGLPPPIGALILANLFSAVGLTLLYLWVNSRYGVNVSRWTLALMLLYPGAIFLMLPYSESLFLFLLMGAFVSLESRNTIGASIFGFALPLCRGNGVFVVLPILFYTYVKVREETDRRRNLAVGSPENFRSNLLRFIEALKPRDVVLVSMPVLGWATYLLFVWAATGHAFEGFHAQRFWGYRHSISNLIDPIKFVTELLSPTAWHGFVGSTVDRLTFLVLISSVPMILRKREWVFGWITMLLVIPAMSGSFTSFLRYGTTCFPCFIAFGVMAASRKERQVLWVVASLMALLQMLCLWRFLNFEWVG